jgi:phosphoglycerate-specific signal transduction histidine kinase
MASDIFIIFLFKQNIQQYLNNKKKYSVQIHRLQRELNKTFDLLAYKGKMERVGTMMENIVHLWRQPLCAISVAGSGMKLKHEIGILDQEEIIQTLDIITSHTQTLSKSLEEFKNLYDKKTLAHSFCLNECMEEVLALLQHDIISQNIHMEKSIDFLYVSGHKNLYIQIFIHLFSYLIEDFKKNHPNKVIFTNVYKFKNKLIIKLSNNQESQQSLPLQITSDFSQELYITQQLVQKRLKGTFLYEYTSFQIDQQYHTGLEFLLIFTNTKYV